MSSDSQSSDFWNLGTTTGVDWIMATKRAFISSDFDHDEDIRVTGNWKAKVRQRIRRTNLTIVMCGEHTHRAEGVAAELSITREENNPYFLLNGRPDRTCTTPRTALPPRNCLIRKRKIGDNRASAFPEHLKFRKSFKYKGLFSVA